MVYTPALEQKPHLWMVRAVSVGHAGTNSFINCLRILIGAGALVPSGISEQLFCEHLGGNLDKVSLSSLLSANGATAKRTMQSIGEVKIRIRFTNMNLIFSGSAVILKNVSFPLIFGVNFLKYNSLSPFLAPNTAKLVHTPTQQSQVLNNPSQEF